MKNKFCLLLLFLFFGLSGLVMAQSADKTTFYAAMKNGSVEDINTEITTLQNDNLAGKQGYEGALLMKKASLTGRLKEKLSFFKAGRIKLETALQKDKDNTELHFLRLVIEEHAPKIVRYHSDIEADKALVIKNFDSMSPAAQRAVIDYTKKSKILHPEDLPSHNG